jgi:hypothetical protein
MGRWRTIGEPVVEIGLTSATMVAPVFIAESVLVKLFAGPAAARDQAELGKFRQAGPEVLFLDLVDARAGHAPERTDTGLAPLAFAQMADEGESILTSQIRQQIRDVKVGHIHIGQERFAVDGHGILQDSRVIGAQFLLNDELQILQLPDRQA